ncbi:zinc finger protein 222-like [Contarinia nasturtii]|uniref:zinc finger protein 222-like n=1 Tax=Contarinia nasturtii TaxID=265458 RepID=UPI0012D44244|nr:zinc finger protein 222-like [Contarinia nasturtii]
MTETWQRILANYWITTRIETEATLQLLRHELRYTGMPFDDNFKEYFLQETNYRIAKTCEKFLNDVRLDEQFIEFLFQNQESTNQNTTTDESVEEEVNAPNNYHQPATDTITPITNQMENSVADWYTLPSSTPYHGMVSSAIFQPFTLNLGNNIDPNNVTGSVNVVIDNEPILPAQVNGCQATISSGIDQNEIGIGIDNPIETSNKGMAVGSHAPTSTQPTIDMNAMNEHQWMPTMTPFHGLSEAYIIPGDGTLQQFASFPCNNIDSNNMTASFGAIFDNDSMPAQVGESQVTLTNRMGISRDDMRNNLEINDMANKMVVNGPEYCYSDIRSLLIDIREGKSGCVKLLESAGAQPSRRIKTNSNGAEKQNGSTSNGKSDKKCEFCTYVTKRPSQLIIHTRKHTGEKPFQCNICAKRFTRMCYLNKHIRTHDQFPFHSSIFRRGFTVKRATKTHEKSCNPRRFECYLCKYATPLKSNLVTHMGIHTGYKPFRCSHCSARFVAKSNLNSHQKRHNNESK